MALGEEWGKVESSSCRFHFVAGYLYDAAYGTRAWAGLVAQVGGSVSAQGDLTKEGLAAQMTTQPSGATAGPARAGGPLLLSPLRTNQFHRHAVVNAFIHRTPVAAINHMACMPISQMHVRDRQLADVLSEKAQTL